MKRLTCLLAVVLLLAQMAFAIGTVTQGLTYNYGETQMVLTFTWTGDSVNGTIPDTAISSEYASRVYGLYLLGVQTNPGTGPPTTLYDLVLNDASGEDVMRGALANRSSTITESGYPPVTGVPIDGTLTLVMSGQSVASATGLVKLYFSKTPSSGLQQTSLTGGALEATLSALSTKVDSLATQSTLATLATEATLSALSTKVDSLATQATLASLALDQASTTSGQKGILAQGAMTTGPNAIGVTGTTRPFSFDLYNSARMISMNADGTVQTPVTDSDHGAPYGTPAPLPMGAKATSTEQTAVDDGDKVSTSSDRAGRQVVNLWSVPDLQGSMTAVLSGTNGAMLVAADPLYKICVTSIIVGNEDTTNNESVQLLQGGQIGIGIKIGSYPAFNTFGGTALAMPTPLCTEAVNYSLEADSTGSADPVNVTITYFKRK